MFDGMDLNPLMDLLACTGWPKKTGLIYFVISSDTGACFRINFITFDTLEFGDFFSQRFHLIDVNAESLFGLKVQSHPHALIRFKFIIVLITFGIVS